MINKIIFVSQQSKLSVLKSNKFFLYMVSQSESQCLHAIGTVLSDIVFIYFLSHAIDTRALMSTYRHDNYETNFLYFTRYLLILEI